MRIFDPIKQAVKLEKAIKANKIKPFRFCNKCFNTKPLKEFKLCLENIDFYSYSCISCSNGVIDKYPCIFKSHPKKPFLIKPKFDKTQESLIDIKISEKVKLRKKYQKRIKIAGKSINEETMFYRAKLRADERGLEFNITLEDITIPEVCPILNIPLNKTHMYNYPSLDRIDNNKGYVKGNIRVISNRANSLKSNATHKELEAIFKDSLNIQGII